MRISVVIPTLGRPGPLEATLLSVAGARPLPDEVIVVDGDSAGSAHPVVERVSASTGMAVRYLQSEPGLTRQRNRALGEVSGDVTLFLDDDVVLLVDDFFAVLDRIYADDGVVGATGRIVEPEARRVGGKESGLRRALLGRGRPGTFTRFGYPRRVVGATAPLDVEVMQGCLMSARTAIAREVGFDELLPGYGLLEDEDFSYRLSRRGRIRYEPRLALRHDNTGFRSQDQRAFGRLVVTNRTYLFRKNFPPTLIARLQLGLFVGVLIAHRVANREWAGARGLLEGAFGRVAPGAAATTGAPVAVTFVSSHAQRGGSERYLMTLLDGLGPEWIGDVIALQGGPFVDDAAVALERAVRVIPTGAGATAIARSAWRLRRDVLARGGSLVVHANGVKAALVCGLAAVGRRAPIVWVKHDFSFDGAVGRFIARRCALVVGVSAAVLESLPDSVEAEVVHSGLPAPEFDESAARRRIRKALDLVEDERLVLLVGRAHPAKGQRELVEAAPAILEGVPAARFVLLGGVDETTPDYAERVRARISELGLRAAVTWVDFRSDVAEWIAAADVVVVPSVPDDRGMGREGFSLVALEAMAVGTPVAAYADGGVPEVLGDCGALAPAGDRAALAAAIIGLLQDDEARAALGRCGRARAGAHFGVDAMVEAMKNVYLRAARSAR